MFNSITSLFRRLRRPFLSLALIFIFVRVYKNRRLRLLRRQLAGKYVLITGASSGLGRALAIEFYEAGAKLILAARRLDELRTLCEQLTSRHSNRLSVQYDPEICYLDLGNPATIEAVANNALRITNGRLDILINNAGMSMRGSCADTSMEVHRRLMQVNYFGHVQFTQLLLKHMLSFADYDPSSKPCIVCISSIQGRIALPYRGAYDASKHAFQAYFDSLRAELAPNYQKSKGRVRILIVAPSYMQTDLSVNAVTGNGAIFGRTDGDIAGGMTAEAVAKQIVTAVLDGTEELVLGPVHERSIIAIRALMPSLYFWLMAKKAAKNKAKL